MIILEHFFRDGRVTRNKKLFLLALLFLQQMIQMYEEHFLVRFLTQGKFLLVIQYGMKDTNTQSNFLVMNTEANCASPSWASLFC